MLEDYRSAPISEKLKATLGFLEKLTLSPSEIRASDARALIDAGISKPAIVDAIYVAYLFNCLTRLADTLGWEVPPPEDFRKTAKILLARGYR